MSKLENFLSISINFIPSKVNCNFVFISNQIRFKQLSESDQIGLKGETIIHTSNIIDSLNSNTIEVNYMDLLSNIHSVRDNSTLMLLNLLIKIGVKKVLLSGFDSYSNDNYQNYVNEEVMLSTSRVLVNKLNNGIELVLQEITKKIDIEFITPTKYRK